jgi:hypothetical protein
VRHGDADSLQDFVERYLVFIHSSALRRTRDAVEAAEVTVGRGQCAANWLENRKAYS